LNPFIQSGEQGSLSLFKSTSLYLYYFDEKFKEGGVIHKHDHVLYKPFILNDKFLKGSMVVFYYFSNRL